jgi:hypothetical protein
MLTAPSFAKLQRVSDPYTKGSRTYVKVLTAAGTEREVRLYDETEYKRLYGSASGSKPTKKVAEPLPWPENRDSPYWRPQKHTLGFDKGYITIFHGIDDYYNDYMRSIGCEYRKWWGWCLPSTKELTGPLPVEVTSHILKWESVSDNDETLYRNSDLIKKAVEDAIYGDKEYTSVYLGTVGSSYADNLTVVKVFTFDNEYGSSSTLHIFKEKDDNVLTWTTSARTLVKDKTYKVKGSIKEHKTFRGEKQTVLTRCRVEEV